MTLRVVKLGGSLLTLPDVVARLRAWLDRQAPADTVLVVGGGGMVDAVRAAQPAHGLSDREAHWLSIRAMALQAEMLRGRMPELAGPVAAARVLSARSEPDQQESGSRVMLLDAWHFMRHEEPSIAGVPLAESWDVTSDSIAARLALAVQADELVLLKSALPEQATLAAMSAAGFVDRYFPQAAAIERVRVVNLRAPTLPERLLTGAATINR